MSERPSRVEEQRLRELERQVAAVTNRMTGLQAVTEALSQSLTPEQVSAVVVKQGIGALGAHAGSLALLTEDRTTMRIIQTVGYPEDIVEPYRTFPVDAPLPLSETARTGQPVYLERWEEWLTRYPDAPENATRTPVDESWAAIPLLVQGRAIGGIGLTFAGARAFSDNEKAFMLALARQCAQALERARLFDEAQRQRAHAEAAERRMAFLAEASAILSASLDYETTLGNMAHLAVPTLADWCAVDMLRDDGALDRLAVAHVDPAKVEWAREIHRRYPTDLNAATGVANVLRTGRSEFYPLVTDEMLAAGIHDPEQLSLMRGLGFTSVLLVPLAARGRTLGVLILVTTQESGRAFTQADLALVEDLAGRAAVAVDNAHLYRAEQISEQQKSEALAQLAQVHRAVQDSAMRQQTMLRDVLYSVTEGRLRLCADRADLPHPLEALGGPVPVTRQDTRSLRLLACDAAAAARLSDERYQDLATAVGEAAMNAVVHGEGGEGKVYVAPGGKVQVWIRDRGKGIAIENLHQATLRRGFTTAGTLGHGFWMMLHTVDRVWLLTGDAGTTVVLEQERTPPESIWQ